MTGNSLLGGDSIYSPNDQIEDEDDDEDENEKSSRNSSILEGSSTKTDNLNRRQGRQLSFKISVLRKTSVLEILRFLCYLLLKGSVFVTFVIFVYC